MSVTYELLFEYYIIKFECLVNYR